MPRTTRTVTRPTSRPRFMVTATTAPHLPIRTASSRRRRPRTSLQHRPPRKRCRSTCSQPHLRFSPPRTIRRLTGATLDRAPAACHLLSSRQSFVFDLSPARGQGPSSDGAAPRVVGEFHPALARDARARASRWSARPLPSRSVWASLLPEVREQPQARGGARRESGVFGAQSSAPRSSMSWSHEAALARVVEQLGAGIPN